MTFFLTVSLTKMEAFPLVEVKVEVEDKAEDEDNQRWCDYEQNDQMLNIKVEKNEEELDNVEQNELDPFSKENVKFEYFAEDFGHEGAASNINSVHEDLKPYQCNQCEKGFSRSSDLNRHRNSVHKGMKSHNCDFCGKSFSRLETFNRHIRSIHEGQMYNCDFCVKSFSRAETLKKHILTIHEGIKKVEKNEEELDNSEQNQ